MSLNDHTKQSLVPRGDFFIFLLLIFQFVQNIGVRLLIWLLKDISNQHVFVFHDFKTNYILYDNVTLVNERRHFNRHEEFPEPQN